MTKVCGHLLVEHLIPKSWVFWEGFPLDVGTLLQGLASIQPQESISEVGH